jgi:hypothetical protein
MTYRHALTVGQEPQVVVGVVVVHPPPLFLVRCQAHSLLLLEVLIVLRSVLLDEPI